MIATWYGIAGAMLIIYVVLDGRNFGAGMSGGVAYVWDPDGSFPGLLNQPALAAFERQEEYC